MKAEFQSAGMATDVLTRMVSPLIEVLTWHEIPEPEHCRVPAPDRGEQLFCH